MREITPMRTVKTYEYKFNKDSRVELEVDGNHIKSISVFMESPSKTISYYGSDYFAIKNTKQFDKLVEVFNKIVEDFYKPRKVNK